MGNFNPRMPGILGEEWAAIRNEDIVFDPTINAVERGHRFTTATPYLVNNVRAYMHDEPVENFGQMVCAAIYPAGVSDDSGPVQRIVVPVTSVVITGDGAGHGSSVTIFGAGSATEALLTPSTMKGLTFQSSPSEFRWVKCLFDISRFAAQLNGKRVIGMNWLYSAFGTATQIETDPTQNYGISNSIMNTSLTIGTDVHPVFGTDSVFLGRVLSLQYGVTTQLLSDLNYWFSGQKASGASGGFDKMNWNYAELLRLSTLGATPITVNFVAGDFASTGGAMSLFYSALEIFVCEERRVAFGAAQIGNQTAGTKGYTLPGQVIPITVRNPLTMATNPQLNAGQYDVVLSSATPLSVPTYPHGYPILNALRQLYEIPTHPIVMTTLPVPLDETAVGREFTLVKSDIMPQISIHTTGGTILEPNSYGRSIAAWVYNGSNPEQEIFDDPVGVATNYQQMRFYARRFGDTTSNLTVFGLGGATGTVSITPSAFDALPSIVDGWKEVTLRCSPTAVLGNVANPTYRFESLEGSPANRWEILGISAPAITAQPSNVLNLVAAPNNLVGTTYGWPANGAGVSLFWLPGYAPLVTGITDDQSTDAVLIFSQDPPTITGLTISTTSMAVTGFTDCGRSTCCVPTAISYNRITWPTPGGIIPLTDSFSRTVVTGSWGTADTGQTYTLTGTASAFSVNGVSGVIKPGTTATDFLAITNVNTPNQDIYGTLAISETFDPAGALRTALVGRYTDASNYYRSELRFATNGNIELYITKVVAGTPSDIASMTVIDLKPRGNELYRMRFSLDGQLLRAKMWRVVDVQPLDWGLIIDDSSLKTGNSMGVFARDETASAGPTTFSYDDLTVQAPDGNFGGYELQRYDAVDAEWNTIMLATSPVITGFNDYEARVGVTSSYQIRQLNALNFAGLWSITGTGTIAEPGVTLPSCGTNKRGTLIFTTNEVQSGLNNLAYAMVWDSGQVSEDFTFIEAGGVQFSQQFNRDMQVAFHGTERGGESFTRELLLSNAAVALPRLGNMRSLRDMAWDDTSYVCVRDDIGDRWYAAVLVQDGSVRRKRRLYNATVTVVEVTDTPSPVNP